MLKAEARVNIFLISRVLMPSVDTSKTLHTLKAYVYLIKKFN